MPLDPEGRRRRARVGGLARHGLHDLAEDDRRILKAEAAERYVRELVDTFPPLTPEQKSRLAVLLLTPGGDGDGPS
jgi:hypothetical protein